ncbi:hypothetical protein DFJ77DRAFT_141311 [Powellomyces hirtus]|nr:hypothetical protein DFJ77DRAFT_141311 [Powellomyces hirtus]
MPLLSILLWLLCIYFVQATSWSRIAQPLKQAVLDRRQDAPRAFPGSSGMCNEFESISNVAEGILSTSYENARTYVSNQKCTWQISAPAGSIVKLRFDSFHTECGWDWVNIFDGTSIGSPQIAALCGVRNTSDANEFITSTGPAMTITFTSDNAVNAPGFKAYFKVQSTSDWCNNSTDCNGFRCVTTNGVSKCQCDLYHRGAFCQFETTGYSPFSPRELHSTAYDPVSDSMYLTFGMNNGNTPVLNDVHVYNFAFQNWTRLGAQSTPQARYSHSSWMVNGTLVVYGGILSGQPTNEIWSYKPAPTNEWFLLPAKGEVPLTGGAAATLVEYNKGFNIYVVGGVGIYSNHFSRYLYKYDSVTTRWTYLRPIPVRTTGASLAYHPETNSLYLLGGLRYTDMDMTGGLPSYIYSIDANEWYLGPGQEPPLSIYGTATYVGNDIFAIHGGYRPLLKESMLYDECAPAYTSVLDAACGQFVKANVLPPLKARRKGQAMILRDDVLIMHGGSNGLLLNDNATIPLSALTPTTPTRRNRDACAIHRWCSTWYDCTDCLARPYCGWCGNQCVYTGQNMAIRPSALQIASVCPAGSTPTHDLDDCPNRIPLEYDDQAVFGSVQMGSSVSYKVYIDEPDRDIHFEVIPSDSSVKLNLTILSIQPIGSFSTTTGLLTISSFNQRHLSATYVFSVAYPAITSGSLKKRTEPTVAEFSVQVSTTPMDNGNGDGDSGGGIYIDAQDIATFIVVFVASILASLIATYLARRFRDRVYLVRLMRAGQVLVLPKEPPNLYEVNVELVEGSGVRRRRASLSSSPDAGAVSKTGESSSKQDIELQKIRKKGILRTAGATDLESNEEVSGSTDALSRAYARTRLRPLAVHPIGTAHSNQVPSIATSYLITFPGSPGQTQSSALSGLKVATAVYRDNTTKKRLGEPAEDQTKSAWQRRLPASVLSGWQYFLDIWRVERLLGL